MLKEQACKERVRTTIDLPITLMAETNKMLKLGIAKSRNALMVRALEEYFKQLENVLIDEEFAKMESDRSYRKLNLQITKEFALSDWEALKIGEKMV